MGQPVYDRLGLAVGSVNKLLLIPRVAHPGSAAHQGPGCGETAAKAVTRAYHLAAMPGSRIRTAVGWVLDALLPRQRVQLGLVQAPAVPLDTG